MDIEVLPVPDHIAELQRQMAAIRADMDKITGINAASLGACDDRYSAAMARFRLTAKPTNPEATS